MKNTKRFFAGKLSKTNHMDYEYDTLMSMLHTSVSKHLLNEHFTLVWANDFYYKTIGYPKEEYESKFHDRPDLYYLYHGYQDELAKIASVVEAALKSGESGYSIITRMPLKEGKHIWVRMVATFVDEYIDGYQVSYTAITNIDDLVRIQQDQAVTYNSIPGFVARCIFRQDETIEVLDANNQFIQFFGNPRDTEEFEGACQQNCQENKEAISKQYKYAKQGQSLQMLLKLNGKDGSSAWFQVRGECVDWNNDEPIYLLIYIDITDITDLREMQKKLEEQAEQLQDALHVAEYANKAKSDFLSRMSHDIRTPMNAITGMTEIAFSHLNDPEKVKDCLKKITLSSKHLLGLINDVLDMSKIESGKMSVNNEVISLGKVLENTVAILQPSIKEHNQEFNIRLHHVRHEYIVSDELRLRQVFINILSNATKFTPEGGSVTMEVTEFKSQENGIAQYCFEFQDTGVGMKAEFLETLFEPFVRERDSRVDKTEGSGLGMAITKKIVDLLGGTIEVSSQVGQGSVFTVCLSFEIAEEPEKTLPALPKLRILVADDDEAMHEYVLFVFEQLGICGEWTESGKEVLEQVQTAQREGRPYDAVILDWRMPQQDGVETARQLRHIIGPHLPILIVSAYDWTDIMEEAAEAGVNGFLPKPLFKSTLYRGLQKYVLYEDMENLNTNPSYDFTGKRILVVEDNEINQEVVVYLLKDAGAIVECADDGAESVSCFQRSEEGYYDLILMDVQMPVMDGYTATRTIRSLPRKDATTVPILAMTADAFAEDITAAFEAGMNGHLTKPLDISSMKREIYKLMK